MTSPLYVVVSGPPGSGKSTLAPVLAAELGLPLLAKDAIKEALMGTFPVADADGSRRAGRAAMEVLFALAGASSPGAVLEANFHRTLALPSIRGLPGRTVEVFCRCSRETARGRYRARSGTRHPGHFDAERSDEEIWHPEATDPVAGDWPVVEVDTNGPAEVAQVLARLRAVIPERDADPRDHPGPAAWHSGPVGKNHFEGRIAQNYDADSSEMFDPAVVGPTVDLLADLAGGGSALELGIGTGRIALPLSERGVEVHGIDLSPDMVARLRAKPGAEAIGVTVGDFASTRVDGPFALAYLVFNTIENLTTQDEQVECFCNVARHLEDGGCFVVEVEVPQIRRLPPGDTVRAFTVTPTRLGFDEFDVAEQRGVSHHYWVAGGRAETFSMPYRYVWPAELDLMARIAGLRLRERWGGWGREPFTSDSVKHVSVWEKPAP